MAATEPEKSSHSIGTWQPESGSRQLTVDPSSKTLSHA